jgi:hypothetical protein
MSRCVNLLLLLSALLSALVGAQAGSRPAQLAVAVARTADAAEVARPARERIAARPAMPLPKLAEMAWGRTPAQAVGPALLFLSRRRE